MQAEAAGDDNGGVGEGEVVVEVGEEGVVDGLIEATAEGGTARRVGLGIDEGVEGVAEEGAARVVRLEGGGSLAVDDAVLDGEDGGDGAGGAGEGESGGFGLIGFGLGVVDAVGGGAGGAHVEFGEFGEKGELSGAALLGGLLRADGGRIAVAAREGDGRGHR